MCNARAATGDRCVEVRRACCLVGAQSPCGRLLQTNARRASEQRAPLPLLQHYLDGIHGSRVDDQVVCGSCHRAESTEWTVRELFDGSVPFTRFGTPRGQTAIQVGRRYAPSFGNANGRARATRGT